MIICHHFYIVWEMHHWKEWGIHILHGINVIMTKDKFNVEWDLHNHNININDFSS